MVTHFILKEVVKQDSLIFSGLGRSESLSLQGLGRKNPREWGF